MDQSARRLRLLDGLPVIGLFGGAFILVGLTFVGLTSNPAGAAARVALGAAALIAFGIVVGSGVVLFRRLRRGAAILEQTVRQVEEAGSRVVAEQDPPG